MAWNHSSPVRFWCRRLGLAVDLLEPDGAGPRGDPIAACRDEAVVLLFVRARVDSDAHAVLAAVRFLEPWNVRRRDSGLRPVAGLEADARLGD